MVFNLLKITPVIQHIHHVSPNMFKQTANEIITHCPFCDDALRAKASNHGHFYLAITSPIFNCFRCNSSGTLISFLLQTGFDDREVLAYISQFIKINFTKDYYKFRSRKDLAAPNKVKQNILESNLKFKKSNKDQYILFNKYLRYRLGDVDFSNFLLVPSLYQDYLVIKFFNTIGENISLRYLNNSKKRYVNNNSTSGLYYFQNIEDYCNITICEGPFDILNLYLYNDIFKNNLFISIRGKNYIGIIEKLILEYLLIHDCCFNIIFDNDNLKNSKRVIKSINTLLKVYGGKIQLKAYKPSLNVNDVADYPSVERIDNVPKQKF